MATHLPWFGMISAIVGFLGVAIGLNYRFHHPTVVSPIHRTVKYARIHGFRPSFTTYRLNKPHKPHFEDKSMPKRKMIKHNYASHKGRMSRHAAPKMKRKTGRYATKRMGSKPRMNPYH